MVWLLLLSTLIPWPHPRGYVAHQPQPGTAIRIDGRLDETAWNGAAWTESFLDIEGHRKPLPRFQTRAKMLWDSRYLYIAAELEEPHVWGTLTQRDSVIFHDNDFEVFLDPDGDNHQYFEIEINALNTVWDLFLPKPYKDRGKADNSWDIDGLLTAVHVDGSLNDPSDRDRGWTVEMAIPWRAFRGRTSAALPPRDGEVWRINFSRVQWRHRIVGGRYEKIPGLREDNWVWSPQFVIDMHRPERWGYLQFSTAAPGTVGFRPDPRHDTRARLHIVYYAQRDFFRRHKRYAGTLTELGLSWPTSSPTPELRLAEDGWEATLDGLGIRQDSLIGPR